MFEFDWSRGTKYPLNSYNQSVLSIIKNTKPVPVVFYPPYTFKNAYVTNLQTFNETVPTVGMLLSPDDAWNVTDTYLSQTKTNLSIYIYQVTDDNFCNALISLHKQKVNVTLLVSNTIYVQKDQQAALVCYKKLYAAGITVRMTAKGMYTYSHQKYWIIDNQWLFLSSGNMGETDYPSGNDVFPPYGMPGWRDVNRDHTIYVKSPTVANHYLNVLFQDYARGFNWSPSNSTVHAKRRLPIV